jgi:hypothetical protein
VIDQQSWNSIHSISVILVDEVQTDIAELPLSMSVLVHTLRHSVVRAVVIVISIVVTLYAALVLLPFYAYDLHTQPADAVTGGAFDPKGYPLFQNELGFSLRLLGILALLTLPIVSALVGIGGLFSLIPADDRRQRRLLVIAVLLSSITLIFYFSPLGRVIRLWYMD